MNSNVVDLNLLSSMKSMTSKFDSVDSIVNYLREPSPPLCISSSTSEVLTSSGKQKDAYTPSNRQRKEKDLTRNSNLTSASPQQVGEVKILPQGHVRYGPITVNPRKKPSKTLFTGRRSKYEVLSANEEERRRVRRDRNRVAATKCREKRENILDRLENEHEIELNEKDRLTKLLHDLEHRKHHLEALLSNHLFVCPLKNDPTPMVFGNAGFLSGIIDIPAPQPPPRPPLQLQEEEFSRLIDTVPILTNSAYETESDVLLGQQQQQQQLLAPMNTSSFESLMNSLTVPVPIYPDSTNSQMLFNSAAGSSSCARQHSSSSEDDSLPPKGTNRCVC